MTVIIDSDDGDRWDLRRVGPLIIFRGSLWEVFVTLQIVWRSDGLSTCLITRWDIEFDACCERHMNKTWDQYWRLFIDMIPDEYVASVIFQSQP